MYDKQGLKLDLQFLSPTSFSTAIISGNMDTGFGSTASVAAADAQGADLVILGASHEGPTTSLVAGKTLATLKDLKGKKIAATQRGATSDVIASELLRRQGLSPTDATIVYIPESAAQVAALSGGAVDGIIVSEPSTSAAVAQGGHIIYGPDMPDGGPVFISSSVVLARRPFIATHRDALKRYLMADMDAIHLIKTDPAAAAKYVGPYFKLDDQTLLENTLRSFGKIASADMTISMKTIQADIDGVAARTPEVGKLKPDAITDFSLIGEIRASGFLDTLK
jgi:NitT/TauT family transport system substrate-binding protein